MRLCVIRSTSWLATADRLIVLRRVVLSLALLLGIWDGNAVATTLSHTYHFEASQLQVTETQLETSLRAGALPRTW